MDTTDAIIFSLTIALGIIIAEFCKTIVQFLTELMFGEEEEEQEDENHDEHFFHP